MRDGSAGPPPCRSLKEDGATLTYRMESEGAPPAPMRLEIEINSREHFSVFGLERRDFAVDSRWFAGGASIPTCALDYPCLSLAGSADR